MGRNRAIGNRLRAGGSMAFSPLSAFAGGKKGLWWDPSDITTGFTDSAGTTPQTATGDPTGKRSDKSANVNHFLQATAAARPIYTVAGAIKSDVLDGADDGGATAVVSAGTFTSAMDFFITLKRSTTANMVVCSELAAANYFAAIDGTASPAVGGAVGTAFSFFVDGAAVGTVNNCTRLQLGTALGSGSYHVLEVRDLDLSTWTKYTLGLYAAFMLAGDVAQLILCESQPALRNSLRTFAGAKGGLVL